MGPLPRRVRLVEVGPRDGLQNEPGQINLDTKFHLVEQLVAAGLKTIETGSFVSPRWVPQMADSDQLFSAIFASNLARSDVSFTALTPNQRGMDRAMQVGVKEVAVFTAATEGFSQRNTNCSIDESLARFQPVLDTASQHNVAVRGYISCALGCPYEGSVEPAAVRRLTEQLLAMGCYEVSIGDTIGVATARQVTEVIDEVSRTVAVDKLALHLHDTHGQAIANILAGLQAGVSVYDAAVGGLGGCPYAPGASGNVATEDVVYLLNGLGIESGVDIKQLSAAGQAVCEQLNRPYTVKSGTALASHDTISR